MLWDGRMPPRRARLSPMTLALTSVLDHVVRRPLRNPTPQQVQRRRATVYPDIPPVSWITGGVERNVGITFGTAPTRDGYDVPLRLYRPRRLGDDRTDIPVILFFHGGGFVEGNVVAYDPLCTFLAAAVGAVVVSVDYRQAPEHRAPTAALDALDTTSWISSSGPELRANASRLAVVGDSAGGNLAAVVAQGMRDSGSSAVRHQVLIYPVTDMTKSSPSIREHAHAPMLTEADIDAHLSLYVPPGASVADPLLSPLYGRLAGLPPALVQTADLDPLRDDGIRYAAALEAAGVPVRLTNYLRAPHGFASFPGAVACGPQHRAELVAELVRHLASPGTGAPGAAR